MKVIDELTDPSNRGREAEAKARNCLEELLSLSDRYNILKTLERLKHIRRELSIILKVFKET